MSVDKLAVNGSLISPITVDPGGTLGGSGTVGTVTVNSGGHIAPGNSPGTLTLTGNLSLLSGAKLDFDLGTPGASDLISMPSNTLTLYGQQFSDFTFMPLADFGPGDYVLIDAPTIQGSLGANAGMISGLPATLSIIPVSGGHNDLVLTVVPEPGTLALLGVGAISLLAYTWRRRRL